MTSSTHYCFHCCSTRKACPRVLDKLKERGGYILGTEEKKKLMHVSKEIKDRALAAYVEFGVGFHHAGLDYADRLLIEKSFIEGVLPVKPHRCMHTGPPTAY